MRDVRKKAIRKRSCACENPLGNPLGDFVSEHPWISGLIGAGALGAAGWIGAYFASKWIGPAPALTTTPATGTTPAGTTLTLNADTAAQLSTGTLSLTPGTTLTLKLPAGASWSKPLSASGGFQIGSAPSSGSNPASGTYAGAGASLIASWTDSAGLAHGLTITIADASASSTAASISNPSSTSSTTSSAPSYDAAKAITVGMPTPGKQVPVGSSLLFWDAGLGEAVDLVSPDPDTIAPGPSTGTFVVLKAGRTKLTTNNYPPQAAVTIVSVAGMAGVAGLAVRRPPFPFRLSGAKRIMSLGA
jgi:hypothetical protein